MPVNKKITALVIFGILIAALALFLPEQEDIAFEVIRNNTDIGLNGTQERLPGVTYYANNSAIQILLAGITNANEDDVFMNLSIDGVLVQPFEFNNLPATVNIRKSSISALIPKGSSYIVQNRTNTTVEWREYPILSGRNGTLSVNITQGGGTGSQNLSQVLNQGDRAINQTINFTNSGNWLKIGYNNVTGLMEINTASVVYYKQAGTLLGYQGGGFAYSAYDDKAMKFGHSGTNYSAIVHNITHGTRWQGVHVNGANNNLNITGFDKVNMYQELDLNNHALTNCSNCGGNQNLSQVLTQGNDANNQSISNLINITGLNGLDINITNGTYNSFTMLGSSGTPFFTAFENNTMRTELTYGGHQIWKIRGTDATGKTEAGYISYANPGGFPGIFFVNSSILFRSNIFEFDNLLGKKGIMINSANGSAFKSTGLLVDTNDNVTIDGLAGGTGNAYVCVNRSTGRLYSGNPGC